jgi:catechol 2,3-dioxygenase-like lactoylglutathione lyase family enzyme
MLRGVRWCPTIIGRATPTFAIMTGQPAVPAETCDFHHAHLFASDLDASLEFYRRWFGAEVAWDGTFAGVRNVFVRLGAGRLHFYDQAPRAHGRNAVHHLGIRVRGLESLIARMRDGGVALRSGIHRHLEGNYLMLEAPDGVLLELFEPDPAGLPEAAVQYFAD